MISDKSTWYLCVVYTGKVHNFRLEIWTLDIIVIVTINFRSSGWRKDYMTLSWCWRNIADIPAGDMSQWIHTLCIHCVSTRFDTIVLIFQLARRITWQRSFWRRRGADLRTRDRITWKRSVWLRGADPLVEETSTTAVVLLTKRSRSSGLRGDYLNTRSAFDEEVQIFQLEKRLRSNVVCLKNKCRSRGLRKNYLTQRSMFDEEVQIFRLEKRVPDAVILLTKRCRSSVWR